MTSASESNEIPSTNEEQQVNEAALKEANEAVRKLKKRLKTQSKSELIYIIIQQASRAQEYQTMCQKMHHDIKKLIEENEKLRNNSDD